MAQLWMSHYPVYGKRHSVSGKATSPMYDRRDSVGGRVIAPRHVKWDSVSGLATAPRHDRWDSLTGKYGWGELTYVSLHDYARTTSRGVGGGVGYGHGSTANHQSKKWIRVCTSHGLDGAVCKSRSDWYDFESESEAVWPSDGVEGH